MRFSLWICYTFVVFINVKCQDQGCICDLQGTANFSNCTNATLTCDCLQGYRGELCQQCDEGFFRLNLSESCQPCDCHASGAANKTCDSNGICSCLGNWIGDKCDECANGFFNFNDSCIKCQCSNQSTTCNKSTGFCINCQAFTTGDHCETCLPGYYRVNDLCKPCNDSAPGSTCIEMTAQPVTTKSSDVNTEITEHQHISIKTVTTKTVDFKTTSFDGYASTALSNEPLTRSSMSTSQTKTAVASSEPSTAVTSSTNQSKITDAPAKSSKSSLPVVLGVVLSLLIILIIVIVLLVYHFWVKPRRRLFRSPLWTIELRRDEDDTLFNDLQTIDQDVLYLDDAYLMDSARVYNKVTTENSRYHPLG